MEAARIHGYLESNRVAATYRARREGVERARRLLDEAGRG
jgi:hypothetical protein